MQKVCGIIQLVCLVAIVLAIAIIGSNDSLGVSKSFALIFLIIGIGVYVICICGVIGGADSFKRDNTKLNAILATVSCLPLIIVSIIHLAAGFGLGAAIITYAIAWIVLALFWPVESIGKDSDDGACIIIIVINKVR